MFENLKEKMGVWMLRGALKENSFRQKILIWFGKKKLDSILLEDKDMESKSLFQSKTIWVAVAQGLAGVVAAVLVANPALAAIGWVAVGKSVIDVVLRMLTDKPIG